MAKQRKITTDYKEIKQWARENKAVPAIIDDEEAGSDAIGIRLDFPGDYDEKYLDEKDTHDIDWSEFFSIFEKNELAFIYEPESKSDPTWAYRFIKRENIDNSDDED